MKVNPRNSKKEKKSKHLGITPPWQKRNTAQESVPYEWIDKNGLAYLGNNLYSITYRFSDVNYKNSSDDEHLTTFGQYCDFLNAFDESVGLQITIANRSLMSSTKSLLLNDNVVDPELKECIQDYNNDLRDRVTGKNGVFTQDKSFSLTISSPDADTAAQSFERLDTDCIFEFRNISNRVQRLNDTERMYLIRDMYRLDDESTITEKKTRNSGIYGKDLVAPYAFNITKDNLLHFGDISAKTFFVTDLPDEISDDFINDICSIDEELFITINIKPQDPLKAIESAEKKLKMLDNEEYNSHQVQIKNHAVSVKTPRALQRAIEMTESFYKDLQTKNERAFLVNILITLRGITSEDISEKAAKVSTKVSKAGCSLKSFYVAHEDAFNSALPLGRNDTHIKRTLTTTAVAALSPFNVVELVETQGLCYGKNVLSNNNIFINRKRYDNANGFCFGASGSGKSLGAKLEIWEAFFRTNDDILIIDPEDEFSKITKLLGGQVVELHPGSELCMNPFDINEFYGGDDEPNPIPFKADFLISLIEVSLNARNGLDPVSRSVIDRVIQEEYTTYIRTKNPLDVPTFVDFLNTLQKQSGDEAAYLVNALEIYVKGSLNMFAHRTNVPLNNRLICFNTKRLGKQLKSMGMTVVQDFCWNLISKNQSLDKNTWLYNDEIHLSLKDSYTKDWLAESWKRGRKYGLIPTGMTQEVQDCLRYDDTRSLIANSEFLLLYKQKETVLPDLAGVINLSPHQIRQLLIAEQGTGLLKAGNSIVSFNNRISSETKLFSYLETDVGKKRGDEDSA